MFLNKVFYREGLLAPRPTPKLEDHPLSAVDDSLFNLFAATLLIGGRSSIRNLRTCHALVTGTHYMVVYHPPIVIELPVFKTNILRICVFVRPVFFMCDSFECYISNRKQPMVMEVQIYQNTIEICNFCCVTQLYYIKYNYLQEHSSSTFWFS